jgi:hypothetical protein
MFPACWRGEVLKSDLWSMEGWWSRALLPLVSRAIYMIRIPLQEKDLRLVVVETTGVLDVGFSGLVPGSPLSVDAPGVVALVTDASARFARKDRATFV